MTDPNTRRLMDRADCDDDYDDDYEGHCGGATVHIGDNDHPDILGPDGEPLRYTRRAPIGFDLTVSAKSKQIIAKVIKKRSAALKRLADK